MMLGRLLSFWDGIFSGAMLNFQGVIVFDSDFLPQEFGEPGTGINLLVILRFRHLFGMVSSRDCFQMLVGSPTIGDKKVTN